MSSTRQARARSGPLVRAGVVAVILPLLLLGCQPSPDGGAEEVSDVSAAIVLHWPAVEVADRYELRVWAGDRLLFEESVADTALELSESLRRTVVAFDSVEVVVRGMLRGERLPVEAIRWRRAGAD